MEYICQHCGANLDLGDVFDHFYLEFRDYTKALKISRDFGWTETNQIHFNRSVIIQCKMNDLQYEICPDCEEKYPFKNK